MQNVKNKDLQIVVMTIADYEEVYQLWLATPGMGLNTSDDCREGIQRYLSRNPNTCFVAKQDGIVGVILSGHDGRRGFIHHTAVALHVRHQGIGSQLVKHALAALRKEGILKVALVAFQRNEEGNAFWNAQGFTSREDLTYRNKALIDLERIDT